MDAEKVAAMGLSQQIFEDLVIHDVITSVPPVRRVIVDSFDVEPEAAEECHQAVWAIVRP